MNLTAEGSPARVLFVGNTMIDTLVRCAHGHPPWSTAASASSGGFLLVTLHRPALVDGPCSCR